MHQDPHMAFLLRMCAFFSTSGCYHGSSCGYAHDVSELQPPVDLRKTTLCINYTRGYVLESQTPNSRSRRCSLSECRFAHGAHELRQIPKIPGEPLQGGPVIDDDQPLDYTETPVEFEESIQRLKLVLESALPKRVGTVISLDDNLAIAANNRRRLDLFTHLDFSNELLIEDNGESLLISISSEVQRFLDDNLPLLSDGDHSLWTLPH